VLVFATTYRILNQPSFPNLPPDQFDVSGQYPFEQKTDPLPIYKDEPQLQDGPVVPENVVPDELAIAKDRAKLEDHNHLPANRSSDGERKSTTKVASPNPPPPHVSMGR